MARKKRLNEGYVILCQHLGHEAYDHIPASHHIEGTPRLVKKEKRGAVQALEELLRRQRHDVLWVEQFNSVWPTYHTRYTFFDGTANYYFWYIWG
jgi:hypothetical protein